MRRPGQWHLGESMLEHDAIVSEPVEGRGMNVGRAITPQMVRAHSVNGDENHVGCGLGRRRRQAATEQEDQEREELERVFQSKLRLSKEKTIMAHDCYCGDASVA